MYTNPCHLEIAREVSRMLHVCEEDACVMVSEVPDAVTSVEEGIWLAQDAAVHVIFMWSNAHAQELGLQVVSD